MSYLDHIKSCNDFSIEGYVPFKTSGKLIGWAKKEFVEVLKPFNAVFEIFPHEFGFVESLITSESRTIAISPIIEILHKNGVIQSWVDETYAITNTFGERPCFHMERAAVAYFGVRSYGVHLNGLVKKSDGIYIWIARRTKDKPFWPGKLDQIVAGGQPAGISLIDNLVKESAEEANISEQLSRQAKLVSEINYLGKNKLQKSPKASVNNLLGMNSDTLFNYDLWLPEDFIPKNTDGEVDEFILMPLEEMAHLTDTTDEFKNNCNLVNIDLLLRQGIISKSHPDYNEIKQQLYAPAKLQ
ncbi:MAG: isopentenyldiphosphate isomerase [Cocleimonas sp.]|jgi:isopentenyldiphosphate isomerase